jgi:hypothetical protein
LLRSPVQITQNDLKLAIVRLLRHDLDELGDGPRDITAGPIGESEPQTGFEVVRRELQRPREGLRGLRGLVRLQESDAQIVVCLGEAGTQPDGLPELVQGTLQVTAQQRADPGVVSLDGLLDGGV